MFLNEFLSYSLHSFIIRAWPSAGVDWPHCELFLSFIVTSSCALQASLLLYSAQRTFKTGIRPFVFT